MAGAGVADGVDKGYSTYIKNVVARLKNNQSGEYFSRIWQKRAMTGLDRDAQGRILVKAKNFTDITVELFRIRDVRGVSGSSAINRPYESAYTYNQPAGYIAFGGPGITHPTEGIDHISHYPGWYAQWPGNISFYQQMLVRRTPGTCSVSSVAPYVLFPAATINELAQGHSVNVNMSLSYRCQGDFVSGTQAGNFAVGFKIDANSFNRAKAMGLTDQAAVSHLLSQNYGSPGYAQGVGVILEREDGLTQPFVIKTYPDLGTGIYDSSKDGWRKFIGTNIGLLIILFSLSLGIFRANYVKNNIEIKIENLSTNYVLFLNTDNGILLYDKNEKKVNFIPWNNLKQFNFLE